jgi:hypothetical protein
MPAASALAWALPSPPPPVATSGLTRGTGSDTGVGPADTDPPQVDSCRRCRRRRCHRRRPPLAWPAPARPLALLGRTNTSVDAGSAPADIDGDSCTAVASALSPSPPSPPPSSSLSTM